METDEIMEHGIYEPGLPFWKSWWSEWKPSLSSGNFLTDCCVYSNRFYFGDCFCMDFWFDQLYLINDDELIEYHWSGRQVSVYSYHYESGTLCKIQTFINKRETQILDLNHSPSVIDMELSHAERWTLIWWSEGKKSKTSFCFKVRPIFPTRVTALPWQELGHLE